MNSRLIGPSMRNGLAVLSEEQTKKVPKFFRPMKYEEGILASTRYFTITRQFKKGPPLVLVSKMISLHSYLVYTYQHFC
jgi:hypothetical protein